MIVQEDNGGVNHDDGGGIIQKIEFNKWVVRNGGVQEEGVGVQNEISV